MKNLLNEQLCIWLEKYCQQSTNRPIQELAQHLLVQVSSTFTLSELIDVLKTSTSKPSYAQSIYFYSALCDWQKRLEQRLNEHETACRRIEGTKYSPRIEPLTHVTHGQF
ncbi:hypothetical protein [Legionella sp. km772]|uniref:hypothetical protein n=1 Tax=Legionella sp. km772 TaxID=2498111 RepID=UPI000F8F75DE|nr:hypothetical protein [Legionella sp. km772]RUR09277.1 hypothetical protein ELY15_09420 [Legionella sp. km772]